MPCIYCSSEGTYNKEHVIPQFLGSFSPLNPTIKAQDELVCNECNSSVFSALETEFTEDSYEGIRGQMLNLSNSKSVRIRGKNVKMECVSGLGSDFFNDIFPFLEEQDEKFVINIMPQIKTRNYFGDSGYQIFQIERLKIVLADSDKSRTKTAEFEKIKSRLKSAQKKNDIAIFMGAMTEKSQELDDAIEILKKYDVKYNEKKRNFTPHSKNQGKFEVSMSGTVTLNICRFVAKVAFNYFCYCALQESRKSLLYEKHFVNIKKFILKKDEGIKQSDIIEISDDPITYHEKEMGKRFIGHIIVFFQEHGNIYSRITFLGHRVYKVFLGNTPNELVSADFGCGHLFDPFHHSIHNLTQQPKLNPSEKEIKQSFGLFRRINLTK